MIDTYDAPQVTAPTTNPAAEDLSAAIRHSIERGPGEEVRCARVYADHYRCNWWSKDETGIAGRIIRSRFLKVTRTADGLLIEDLTR